jgi:hypothetical protein
MGCGAGYADVPMVIAGKTFTGGCKIIVCRYLTFGNIAWDFAFSRNGEAASVKWEDTYWSACS